MIGTVMPSATQAVAEPQEGFGLKEELRDGAGRPGIDLALQPVECRPANAPASGCGSG